MTAPGPLIAILLTLLLVGAIIQFLIVVARYRNEELGATRGRIDGDVVYTDDRLNELLYSGARDDAAELDFDPDEVETVACSDCQTLNDATYTFCRNCAAELANA